MASISPLLEEWTGKVKPTEGRKAELTIELKLIFRTILETLGNFLCCLAVAPDDLNAYIYHHAQLTSMVLRGVPGCAELSDVQPENQMQITVVDFDKTQTRVVNVDRVIKLEDLRCILIECQGAPSDTILLGAGEHDIALPLSPFTILGSLDPPKVVMVMPPASERVLDPCD